LAGGGAAAGLGATCTAPVVACGAGAGVACAEGPAVGLAEFPPCGDAAATAGRCSVAAGEVAGAAAVAAGEGAGALARGCGGVVAAGAVDLGGARTVCLACCIGAGCGFAAVAGVAPRVAEVVRSEPEVPVGAAAGVATAGLAVSVGVAGAEGGCGAGVLLPCIGCDDAAAWASSGFFLSCAGGTETSLEERSAAPLVRVALCPARPPAAFFLLALIGFIPS